MHEVCQPSTPKITHSIPRRLAKKATQTIPLVFISSANPGQLGIEIFDPNAENDPDSVLIPLFERPVRKWPISRSSPTASSATCTNAASAQADPKVAKAMKLLKAKTAKLGAPKIEGKDAVEGKDVPALYFGKTKMNNNFKVVDEVVRKAGGTATLFVKAGDDDYVRVSTNVPKPDGSGRAIGTVLDPTGKAIAAIRQGQAFYGEVPLLGTPYITGYEPIRDGSGNVTGIYYVGYKKPATISKRGFRKRKAA